MGTPGYIAPELFGNNYSELEDAKISDMYSVGVTMYNFLHRFHVFDTDELTTDPPALLYRKLKSYHKIKCYYSKYMSRPIYKILDFLINVLLENDLPFRLSSHNIMSIFNGTYKYLEFVPDIQIIGDLNHFNIETSSDIDCDCSDSITSKTEKKGRFTVVSNQNNSKNDKNCILNPNFIKKSLKCKTKCSKTPEWLDKCKIYAPSIYHSLQNALDNYRLSDDHINSWINIAIKQHHESYDYASSGMKDHNYRIRGSHEST